MSEVTYVEVEGIEHAIIDNGDGSFTSMTKAEYDRIQALKEAPVKK